MHKSFIVLGVGALLAAGTGFWWLHQQPAAAAVARAATAAQAQPNVPHVQPSPFEAEAPAADADPDGRLGVQRLLRAREFTRLTRLVEAKQARVEQDIRRERELARVLHAFATADPTLRPLLDDWVAAEPASYVPRLARAEHGIALAWARRGTGWAKDTSEKQRRDFREFLERVVEDARAALDRNTRLGEAYRMLIVAATGLGGPETCIAIAERALSDVPASLNIRVALTTCLLPRWGGSYELVEAVAKQSDTQVEKNPSLAALHGFVEWDQGRLAGDDHADEALDHFARALGAGEYWLFRRDRAWVYRKQNRYADALADTERALAVMPDEPDLLLARVRALVGLGRLADAVPDVRLVAEIDATSEGLAAFQRNEIQTAAYEGYQLIQMKNHRGAIARLTLGIDLGGGNAETHYWRGRAYLLTDDREHALADFEKAIRFDARHFESYRNIDYVLAKRGDWDGVIRHWTLYLELAPMDGRAYLERAGAQKWKGDRPAALADLSKACDLGAAAACQILSREGAW